MRYLLLAAALFAAGPSIAQQSMAPDTTEAATDVPSFPGDRSVEKIIRSGLVSTFKDPDSAQIKITRGPRMATAVTDIATYSGWMVCAQINAKNSYGAYTGYADYLVVIEPSDLSAKPLPRLTRTFENVNAWRSECYLKHDNDPPALGS